MLGVFMTTIGFRVCFFDAIRDTSAENFAYLVRNNEIYRFTAASQKAFFDADSKIISSQTIAFA